MSRKLLQDYFNFSKKELNGTLILFLLIFLVVLIPIIYQTALMDHPVDIARFKKEVEAFNRTVKSDRSYSYRDAKVKEDHIVSKPAYFNFDPNGLSEENWRKLGLSDKQIKVLKHYEAKGGKFYRKEDVKKMYVISPETYQKLEPFIQINLAKLKPLAGIAPHKPVLALIDINQADSLALQNVRGIGPAFASRIIRYRDRLGGFYQLDQLREVYGVDSAHFNQWLPQLKISAQNLRKININTAVFDDLKRHPYLSYKQINALIQFRTQHGLFKNRNDLRQVVLLNDEILRKLEPYLTFQ